ncbi:hypothetical protein [Streptomyces sp. NPDC018000]|uniref:hypothetical protein n=1 Tax=Streptomyces sp. NPDC018000 TaxID=3365028 RepID=UPI00379B18A8
MGPFPGKSSQNGTGPCVEMKRALIQPLPLESRYHSEFPPTFWPTTWQAMETVPPEGTLPTIADWRVGALRMF